MSQPPCFKHFCPSSSRRKRSERGTTTKSSRNWLIKQHAVKPILIPVPSGFVNFVVYSGPVPVRASTRNMGLIAGSNKRERIQTGTLLAYWLRPPVPFLTRERPKRAMLAVAEHKDNIDCSHHMKLLWPNEEETYNLLIMKCQLR